MLEPGTPIEMTKGYQDVKGTVKENLRFSNKAETQVRVRVSRTVPGTGR